MRFESIVVDPYEGFGDDAPPAPSDAEKEGREAMRRLRKKGQQASPVRKSRPVAT